MPPQYHVRHFPLALGQQVAAEVFERRLHPLLEIVTPARVVITLEYDTMLQATLAEFGDEFAHQWLDGPQQVQLLDPQAFTAKTLKEAHGNLRVMTGINQVKAVLRTARLQVVSLVVLTVEKVVRGNFFQVIKPFRQPLFNGQAERIEQIPPEK